MADAAEKLRQLGFGEYEARAYVVLLQRSPLNGYELAKATGIPRPNVYGVLQKLEEKGAAVRIDDPSGSRFAATPPAELLERLDSQFRSAIDDAWTSLMKTFRPVARDQVWNLHGYQEILGHARALLRSANEGALVALRPQEAAALSEGLGRLDQSGAGLTTLCLEGCPQVCGHCRGTVHRHPVQPGEESRWLIISVDGAEMLAAEFDSSGEGAGIRSRQPLLVDLASWYVQQTATQAAMMQDLSGPKRETLSPATVAMLSTGQPGMEKSRFFRFVRRLTTAGSE